MNNSDAYERDARSYRRWGYLILRGVLSRAAAVELARIIDDACAAAPNDQFPTGTGFLFPRQVFASEALFAAMFSEKLVDALKAALGTSLHYIPDPHAQVNMYGVDDDGRASWHVDSFSEGAAPYLRAPNYRFARIGLYLQDNSPISGGGISVAPALHRFPIDSGDVAFDFRAKHAFERVMRPLLARRLPLEAGDAVIFDSRLPHASTLPAERAATRVEGDLLVGELPAKHVLYWNACNGDMVGDFLVNAKKRAAREKKGRPLFFNDYLRMRYPADFPDAFVRLARLRGVAIAQHGEEERFRHEFAARDADP